MKILSVLVSCCLWACNAAGPTAGAGPSVEMVDQQALVEAHVISRGKFQYVLHVPQGRHQGRYVPEKELADSYCRDGMQVVIDARILEERGTIYRPGPTDIPESEMQVPMVRITRIRRQ